MMVIAILGILVTLTAPTLWTLRDRVTKIVCAGHLRSLHCSLGAYLNDNEQWPQCPEDLTQSGEDQFWINALNDYGAPENVWKCPSIAQRMEKDTTPDAQKIHYTPTQFDENPLTPRKWASMPWLIEISDVHGGGNLLIRTDGSVRTIQEAMKDAG